LYSQRCAAIVAVRDGGNRANRTICPRSHNMNVSNLTCGQHPAGMLAIRTNVDRHRHRARAFL
jgi:hypothetical protein